MNQSKFSLADLLTALGAIGFSFFCFLSLNFLNLGDTQQSVIVGITIGLTLGGLAFGAKLLKLTARRFKTSIILEWLLLFLFAIIAFFAIFPFSHYFVVTSQKDGIKQNLSSNIIQAEGIFTDYERYANNRLQIYENRLKSVVANKNVNPSIYRDYGFVQGTDDQTQISNKIFTLSAQLYPSNYEELEKVFSNRLKYFKAKIINWSPIGIIIVLNTAEAEIVSLHNTLKEYSTFRAKGEIAGGNFDYPLTFNDVSKDFTSRASPTLLSILYSVGLYILMLLSYIVSRRHPRYPGLKVIFGTGETNENEL